MQSKRGSFIEAVINTFLGFMINLLLSPIVYWVCDMKFSWGEMTICNLLFTSISVARGFLVRRYFNHLIKKAATKI